ncbi:MAG: transglycosylase SLT domain-containing protein [Methylococcales bacterium]
MCWLTMPVAAISADLAKQRNDFLLAEKLLSQGQEDGFLVVSAGLTDYPLYPFLQYQWLKDNLSRTDNILTFLLVNKESRYAGLLRGKWLTYLAEQQRWPELLQNYQPSDDTALACHYYWAMYKTGNTRPALAEAKRLWLVGNSQPNECEPLFAVFELSAAMTGDLIWQRYALALQENNVHLAEHLQRLLPESDRRVADLWLNVHKQPGLIENALTWSRTDPLLGRVFAHGVERMAKTNLEQAVYVWDRDKLGFKLDAEVVQRVERKLALALAFKRHFTAYERLSRLDNADAEVREWRVRAALLEQNWSHVSAALAVLSPEERQTPHWQYWLARALEKTGDTAQSKAILTKLSEDRSFYGFMAADTLNKPYLMTNKPVPLATNDLQMLANQPDFKAVQEFIYLDRLPEARKQWSFAVKKLSKAQLMVAAKLAQQWHWDQIAIFTLAKADYWDDIDLRFPMNYLSQIEGNAGKNNLDPALVLGLVRQESVFDKDVQSPVGAKGLMQIMPKTGQQIARDLNENWHSEQSLLNADVNVRYGTFYFKQLLNRFDGHVALATAAYNAGPHNVVKWLPAGRFMPADIWIETIPFKETRKYVTSVLTYAMVYQQRLQRDALRVKNLLLDVGSG